MERKLTVLVVEDEEEECAQLRYCMEESPAVKLQNVTNDSQEALELVRTGLPDAVILDLELHMGGGNGIMFLAGLRKLELQRKPYILVTTNNSSNTTYNQVRELGADFIISKHERNYSAKFVVDFLTLVRESIFSTSRTDAAPEVVSEEERNHRLAQRIQRELDYVGISPKAVGYKYLTDAILLTYLDPQPNLSRKLSDKYHKTDVSIERAMQNAINRAWKVSDPDDLLEHYKARVRSDKGVPTMMEFVCYYAKVLEQGMS